MSEFFGYEFPSVTVNSFEVTSFESCELISNQELCNYIETNIPVEHLEGCTGITYNPNAECFQDHPDALGCYSEVTREISINEHMTLEGTNGLLETVTHEIGHNVHTSLREASPDLALVWNELYETSYATGCEFISEYATTTPFEDFAECYANYIRNPEVLALVCPTKFAFMDKFVFNGIYSSVFENAMMDCDLIELGNYNSYTI